MPIYEYTCSDCGHEFEKLRRMSAGPPPCPSCAGEHCEKQVSASAFILKGSGWYKDHYGLKKGDAKKEDGKKASSSESSSASDPSTSGAADSGSASSTSKTVPKSTKTTTKAST